MNMQKLKESLVALDLKYLVGTIIHVDRHRSKMGTDRDIIVLAFKVNDRNAANDLENFIERGYSSVLDADSSVNENENSQHTCFVEIYREKSFIKTLNEMLDGIKLLTGIDNFIFKYYKSSISLTKEEFYQIIPLTPKDYDRFIEHEQNIKDQLNNMRRIAKLPIFKDKII